MKTTFLYLLPALSVLVSTATAATLYVDANCPTPAAPYTNWATAAATIQDAVDAAAAKDDIVVTNGVYATGGRSNARVYAAKLLTIRSVNGPDFTTIQGYQVPGTTNGSTALRCAYLPSGVLSGFTLTNGATISGAGNGGGVWGGTVTNCVLVGNSAYNYGGGAYGANLYDCEIKGNTAYSGGGIYQGYSSNCTLTGNAAHTGGGAYDCRMDNCILTDNRAGIAAGVGGAGGGANGGSLANCFLSGNWASTGGGFNGGSSGWAVNCTFTGNSADYGGGAYNGDLESCIIWSNTAFRVWPNYGSSAVLNYCCTTPLPANGVGNISLDPQLASVSHLSAGSPCRGAARLRGYGADLDGDAWSSPSSMGCDEYLSGMVTGALNVAISAPFTNIASSFPLTLTAMIDGRLSTSVWDFGDGTTVSNRPYASHAWSVPGDYVVRLTAFNESHPEGVNANLTVQVQPVPVHYVSNSGTNPVHPFSSWDTAATEIQSAVDAASLPGAVVLVGDGVYSIGGHAVDGTMTNRVVVNKPVVLQSLNGPSQTIIQGYQLPGTTNGDGALRCVYLSSGAVLSGFTLTGGGTRTSGDIAHERKGGGVWCESLGATVSNCLIMANSASERGGGAFGGTIKNCVIGSNSANSGGGAGEATLIGCTLRSNWARTGGGAYMGWVENSLLISNWASSGGSLYSVEARNCTFAGGGAVGSTLYNCILYGIPDAVSGLSYCCLSVPAAGPGNFTNAPLFVDAVAGDFHLQSTSPCINAGCNAYASGAAFDGNPRIAGDTVDVGAYEFPSPASRISYAWLQQHGLPCNGSADMLDSDADGMNNWQEWIADTDPLDSNSRFWMFPPVAGFPNVSVSWQSSSNRTYFLERAAAGLAGPLFTRIASDIRGRAGTTAFSDTNAPPARVLYRVGVQSR